MGCWDALDRPVTGDVLRHYIFHFFAESYHSPRHVVASARFLEERSVKRATRSSWAGHRNVRIELPLTSDTSSPNTIRDGFTGV